MQALRTILVLGLLCALAVAQEPVDCTTVNPVNGLFYNLTAMTRSSTEPDYFLLVPPSSLSDPVSIYFANVCGNVTECPEQAPVCEESYLLQPDPQLTYTEWGNLNAMTWLPYQPNTSADGVTLCYGSDVECGSGLSNVCLNILCDKDEFYLYVESESKSDDGCHLYLNMRSVHACGAFPGVPLTCHNTTNIEEPVCTTSGQGNFECDTGKFTVKVTGNQNVPKYSFWANAEYSEDYYYSVSSVSSVDEEEDDNSSSSTNSTVYKLQFQHISQNDASGKKVVSATLPALGWEFTTPEVILYDDDDCTQVTSFNITNLPVAHPEGGNEPFWSKLVFVNHLVMSGNVSSLKFDVVMEDVQWAAGAETLVLEMQFDGGANVVTNSSTYAAGEGYLQIVPTAYGYVNLSNPDVNQTVSATLTADTNTVSITYSKFDGSLVHDPTIGVAMPAPVAPPAPCTSNACEFKSYTLSVDAKEPSMSLTDGSTSWEVQFGAMQEIESGGAVVSGSYQDFSEIKWTISTPTSSMVDGVAYTFLSLTAEDNDRWDSLVVEIQAPMKEGMSHVDAVIKMSGYQWKSSEATTSLQFLMYLTGPGSISYSYDSIVVGNSYLRTAPLASVQTKSGEHFLSTVAMAYTDKAQSTLTHFDGDVALELAVGISTTSDPYTASGAMVSVDGTADGDDLNSNSTPWWVWLLVAVGATAAVAVVVAIAVVVTMKQRKGNYDMISE